MKKTILPNLGLALLLSAMPVSFASTTATAVSNTSVEVRAEQATDKARSNTNAVSNENSRNMTVLAEKEQRFTDKKLQVCNKNQDKFKARMQQITDRGAKQLDVFRKIADRTKAFYETKNYDIGGYTALTADVDARYDQSVAAISVTQMSQNEWSCDDSNPQTAMRNFTDAKKNETAVLKAYKDKVRELILLVKQAGGN